MPNLASTLRQEIRRAVAREMKKTLRPLRKVQRQVKALRLEARGGRRELAKLERRLLRLRSRVGGRGGFGPGVRRGPRMAAEAIRSLRDRFAMTRVQFAKLLDVSPGSIFGWESGRTVPRGRNVQRLLEAKKKGAPAGRRGRASGRRGPGRPRGRRGRRGAAVAARRSGRARRA
jgi:hypothetical protein